MRFISFEYRGVRRAGIIREDRVLPLGSFSDLGAFLHHSEIDKANDWLTDEEIPLALVDLRPPIPHPPKIIAVGLNYRGHAEEQKKTPPENPMLFSKSPSAVIGPDEAIRLPPEAPDRVDPEVEMAVVIGRGGFRIPKEEAFLHVAGVTILNDVSARDLQKKEKQYFRAKSFRTFAPMGPMMVTCDELDPSDLRITLRKNGELMQESRTSDLVFDIPFLVNHISSTFPIEPGDVISTGTPAGVGIFRDPPVFLRHGDEIECELEGVGLLRNRVEK
jgi:2-keto-4-pentenoate hydratase/2-oxohepta-3-ene-1,7-dioic acid hydratase in catechol pathway